ncbi:MAG: hypothetical protein A2X35_12885 [Elusimicrobia bacterium GWA2_61_42]|nr:MAG: hypothetical protein A2X35_12885 [Elusimicrobia bacterium GWA2_61_42]OGR77438.1 MAG: hypothetical protein A2X38_10155 [Elusimicrobia bacterium GWC2_61_25]
MEKRKKQEIKLSQAPALRQDLRLFGMLARSEGDFLRLAAELEADPLFARLRAPGPDGQPAVVRKRFHGATYAFSLACGADALAAAADPGGAGDWLADRPAMLELARRAGLENFELHFLADSPFDPAAAARACKITPAEAAALKVFVDAFTMAHERVPPAALPQLFLRCSARIGIAGGRLEAAYTHPAYFHGAYVINGPALTRLLKSGALSRAEAVKVRKLAAAAQRVSWRKAGFHRTLAALLEEQKAFLLGKGPLKPLTQRELSARVGLNPATVSRLLAGRTVLAPWGEEVKLKDLFRPKSALVIDKMKDVMGAGVKRLTDSEVAAALKTGHGLRISRRTVNLYRKRAGL